MPAGRSLEHPPIPLMKQHTFLHSAAIAAIATSAVLVAEEPKGWQTTANINASVAKGNSDTLLVGAAIKTLKKWEKNEVALGADTTYGNNRDQASGLRTTTAQNYGAFAQYNRLITERWYFAALVDGRQDRIAGVNYRVSLAPSAGYYAVKNDTFTLSFEAGPGFIFESLKGAGTENYLALRLAENFRWKINERASLQQKFEYLPKVEDFGNYVANFDLTLSSKITEKLSVNVTFQDFYRSEPAPGRKENDLRLLAGLGYTF
jgi:putative salt-induced outer membrane protein YdiY